MKLTSASLNRLMLSDDDPELLVELEEALQRLREAGTMPDWLLSSLFQLLERHPDCDLGAPGGIVHFVEAYPRPQFTAALLESLQRSPTNHTTWMLNRLINGTSGPERAPLITRMKALLRAKRADVRASARRFVAYQKPKTKPAR